jgi:hypothetical protein
MTARRWLLAVAGLLGVAVPARAQSWLLRFNAAAQRVQFRGVSADSVPDSLVTTTATTGPVSPDGFAANCSGNNYCYFFRPGPILTGIPASAGVDMSLWGLGVQGLSVRVSARVYGDLSGSNVFPGTSPPFNLLEGYAEYLRDGLTVQAGRMLERGRLASVGTSGIDGLRATWRFHDDAVEVGGYAGWGFARGTILTVTSPAVDPLADYQPATRQLVVGTVASLHLARLDVSTEYRREIDPLTDYIVAERAAVTAQVRLTPQLRLVSSADYDIAQALLGSGEASLAYTGRDVWVTVGARHYRPFFDLWTVWGVFSPVPYNGVTGTFTVTPMKKLQLSANGEWFRYDNAAVGTPTVTLEDRGWRWGVSGTLTPAPAWTIGLSGHGELTPGASSQGADMRASWRARDRLELSAEGGSLERPLELRFQDAGVRYAGGSADYRAGERWQLGISLDRYWDSRDRPDAASFDWNQWRVSGRVSMTLRSSADRWLPPARPAGTAP